MTAAAAASPGAPGAGLPRLRQDLEIVEGPRGRDGRPSFILADHLRHRYFALGEAALALLSGGRGGGALPAGEKENVETLGAFLSDNQLADSPGPDGWRMLYAQHAAGRHGIAKAAVHNYLYFRIPLFRPQPFLHAAWPWVSWMFTGGFAALCIVLGVVALALLSRQWASFVNTFMGFLSFEGALAYAASLIGVKALHELSHAFMARKYGVRVTSMGVAFMVLAPVFYCDTSAGWRLERRKRLMISGAGIFAELAIAVFATLAWIVLPDGPLRSIAFSTATIGWLMSLAVNLNPLMRFDGYYLLSDLIGIENLQERGFALARWRMREALFGFGDPAAEPFSPAMRRTLLAYSYATWIYRLGLFIGIAILVYHFFIKPVAIVLFLIEVLWFILLPVWREIKAWAQRAGDIRPTRQALRTAALFSAALFAVFFPWQQTVPVPAVLHAAGIVGVYPRADGRIVEMRVAEGARVKTGDVLARLESPDTPFEIAFAKAGELRVLTRLKRLAADSDDRSVRTVLERELGTARDRLRTIGALERDLVLTAVLPGTVRNVDTTLRPGVWVSGKNRIAVIAGDGANMVEGYMRETDRERVSLGAAAIFIPEEPLFAPARLRLSDIGAANAKVLALHELADRHGGAIAVTASADRSLEPAGAWYPVRFAFDGEGPAVSRTIRGTVHVDAEARSIAGRILRRAAGILVRESGF